MPLSWANSKPLRWLDFDLENRPLSYAGPDWTTAEITAIAWMWVGQKRVNVRVLTPDGGAKEMLRDFCKAWDSADGVTGHYVLKHDIPIIQGALMEYELPLLGPKLVHDTKVHLVKKKDLSASQESLGAMYGVSHRKEHMSQVDWRKANRLTAEGIKETKRRVMGDVRQHVALRQKLIEAGALRAPSVWHP